MDRDIRYYPVPHRGTAENDGLKNIFIQKFQHGQQVIPGSTAKIIR